MQNWVILNCFQTFTEIYQVITFDKTKTQMILIIIRSDKHEHKILPRLI